MSGVDRDVYACVEMKNFNRPPTPVNYGVKSCLSKVFFIIALLLLSYSLNAEEDTPTIKRLLSSGMDMLVKQKSHAANILFKQIVLLNPNHAEAYFRLGQSHMQQRKAKEAVEHIVKSTQLDPMNMIYGLYLAKIYDKQGDLVKAQAEYQRLMDSGSNSERMGEVEMLFSLTTGRILAQKNEMSAALLVFNGLLLDYPDDPQVLFNISNAYMALNRYDEAEAIYKKLYEINNQNETVNLNLAKIYSTTNRPLLAMEHLQNIMKLGRNDARHRFATIEYNIIRGRELLKINDWNGALQAYKIAVELDPTRTEAFFNISLAHLQLGNIQLAERGFLNVLRIKPDDFLARLNLAQLYYNSEQTDQAKEHLTYIIENDKSGQFSHQAKIRLNVIHTLLADKALDSGNIDKSLMEYSKALDFFSANVKASFNRGMIYIQKEEFAAAQLEFESVIRHEPDNIQARNNLAHIYEQLNKFAKASEQYEAVLEADPDSKEGKYAATRWRNTKARGLWEKGQLDESEAMFKEIVADEPGNLEAYTYLGIIQSSKGDFEDAAASYQNVLNLRPTHYSVKLLLGKVYEDLGLDSLAANEYRSIIFAGGTIRQIPEAEHRLEEVEARLSGFSNSLSYKLVYDSNLNLNDDIPYSEIRSDLAVSFLYAIKTTDDLSFRFSWSPTYSDYHLNQTDYYRTDLFSKVSYGRPDDNWSASFTSQEQDNLVNDRKLNEVMSANFSRGKKMFLSPFLAFSSSATDDNKVATSGTMNFALRHLISFSSTPIESLTTSLNFSMFQNSSNGIGTSLSYMLSIYRSLTNEVSVSETSIRVERDTLTGNETRIANEVVTYDPNDYESNSHTLALNFRKMLAPGVVGSFALNSTLTSYINADSGVLTRDGRSVNRLNFTIGSGASLYYFFFKDLSIFTSASYQKNFSSLPVGLSTGLSGEDAIASLQSTSLGDYSRYNIEVGFLMNF